MEEKSSQELIAKDNEGTVESSSTPASSSSRINKKAVRTKNSTFVPATVNDAQQQMDIDVAGGPNDLNALGI